VRRPGDGEAIPGVMMGPGEKERGGGGSPGMHLREYPGKHPGLEQAGAKEAPS
jgi:hypothetical protein